MVASYRDVVRDNSGYQRPVEGALVYLLDANGGIVPADDNPVRTNEYGVFEFTGVADGVYTRDIRLGGVSYARDTINVGIPPQFTGATGPSNNTRLTLALLKAAAITDRTSLYDGSLWTWTEGDFTGQADDVNIVKADSTALTVGAWVRQRAAGVPHKREGTPAVLSVAKLLDALGVIPQQFGWDGLPTSDATSYAQMAIDHCNDGVQAETHTAATDAPSAMELVIPAPMRITAPLMIPNRRVDRTNFRFGIQGRNSGVMVQDGDFVMFDTPTPELPPDGDGNLEPNTEFLHVQNLRFINRDRYTTGSAFSERFLRVAFYGCEWWGMPCMIGERYAQEWLFINGLVKGMPTGRPFFQSHGAYAIRALMMKFQFSWENAAGGFLLRHPSANKAVDSCSFDQCSFESHGGPFLAAGQVEGSGVSRLYAENNEGPVIDLRCIDNGSRNDGFRLENCKLQANSTNVANASFGNVLVGPGGLLGTGNSSRGGLYDNAVSVVSEGGLNLRKGHAFGELESSGDRLKTASRLFQIDVDAQIDLIPDPLSAYNVKIIANTVIVYPINGTQNHTVALPPPIRGRQVRMINRLTAPTQDFEVRPSYSADGSKFRGGATNAGLVHAPGVSKTYLCLEDGIWDVAA